MDSLCFFQTFFFSTKCAPFLLKIGADFYIDVWKEKEFELLKIVFITHLSNFSSKVFLSLKIMDFENVTLTKVVHTYVIKGMNA